MSGDYDYLQIELERGRPTWASFARYVRDSASASIARNGGQLLGLFAPQLGFASNEAVALFRMSVGAQSAESVIAAVPGVKSVRGERLQATVRPHDGDVLNPGGIYVHRWFTIDGKRTADFIDLSNRAWGGFEGSYDTQIFGLFSAAPNEADRAQDQARLLLLTWYRSHGVWEQSREQAHDTKSLFAQRHELTRSTIGRSSILAAV